MAPDTIDLGHPQYYINRELSTIEFNRRVLLESLNDEHPLLERVKFSAIHSNNMDEFFMVRVASIRQQMLVGATNIHADGLTPREQLANIQKAVTNLVKTQSDSWRNDLEPQLEAKGIHVRHYDQLGKGQKKRLAGYFETEIFPVLTPLAFDPGHPFPHISNLSLNLAVVIRQPNGGETHFARVKVPNTLPRLVNLKPFAEDELVQPSKQAFVWLEEVIIANLGRLFPGMEIVAAHPFRVTRNTDVELQEDEADDLMQTMEANLRRRHFGFVVRLEVAKTVPEWILDILTSNLEADRFAIYIVDGPLGLSGLFQLMKLDRPDLKDPPHHAQIPPPLRSGESVFSVLRRRDILLHHPYDSFSTVVDFVERAAEDPKVLAIKQTLYRVGPNPPIVRALMRARENGKQVTVLVELKARFDEESNIEWARALENVGVHVVYGLIGLKTHAKVCLIVRRERERLRRYVHLGTGNYNSSTARIYTDLGFMTADADICADVSELFNYLTGYSNQDDYRKCLIAPVTLRSSLQEAIKEETKRGAKGKIIFKVNHLVDARIIKSLYKASQAGVTIQLMIRGICSLRPGIPGVSENIRVVSVIGRFLEHTRIFYFHNEDNPLIFAGSADMMSRNLDRRVELVFPIEDMQLKKEVIDNILAIYWQDTAKSYELNGRGEYVPLFSKGESNNTQFSAQNWYLSKRQTHLLSTGIPAE